MFSMISLDYCTITFQFGPTVVIPGAGHRPLLNISHLRSLQDLHSFFHSVSVAARAPEGLSKGHKEGTIKIHARDFTNMIQEQIFMVSTARLCFCCFFFL